jgi:NADH-ubiquinone oxidoreductase chain 3
MTLFILFVSIIAILFLVLNLLFAPHNPYAEKFSSFECGFHSFLGQNRSQFNVKFFIFGLVFLLFDLEITLVFPFAVSQSFNNLYGLIIVLIFLVIVTIGFIYELGKGALKIDSKQNISLLKGDTTNTSISYVENKVRATNNSFNTLYSGGNVLKNVAPLTFSFDCVGGAKRFYSSNSDGSNLNLSKLKFKLVRASQFSKILIKNLLRFIFCIMPFIIVCKSLYCCLHNDNWTFIYLSQQILSHIPFIGSYLFHLLSEQVLSIDLVNNNQFIGNLMFSGSFGASIGRSLLEVFWDKDKILLGDFGSNEIPRPKDKGFFMQASNTESDKQSSKEGIESSQKASASASASVSSSGVSSTYPSFENFDKLLEERNKIISETKKLILGTDNTLSSIAPQANKIELARSLTLMRHKNYELFNEFIKAHNKFLDLPFLIAEIKPLVKQIDAVSDEFSNNMKQISIDDPNYLKKTVDLENKFMKKQMSLGLDIEKKLISEVKIRDKQGKYPEYFFGYYRENIQKAWIQERELFSAEQKKLRKELGELVNKKA